MHLLYMSLPCFSCPLLFISPVSLHFFADLNLFFTDGRMSYRVFSIFFSFTSTKAVIYCLIGFDEVSTSLLFRSNFFSINTTLLCAPCYWLLHVDVSCFWHFQFLKQFLKLHNSSTRAQSVGGLRGEAFSFVFLSKEKTVANRGHQTAQNCWKWSKSGCLGQRGNRYCQAPLCKLFRVTVSCLASTWDDWEIFLSRFQPQHFGKKEFGHTGEQQNFWIHNMDNLCYKRKLTAAKCDLQSKSVFSYHSHSNETK